MENYKGDHLKKIGLVVLMFVLLATVANAASVNGEFEGNPIVKVKSSGKTLHTNDVPAIIYQGRTMVPIGMLKELGATVSWDQKTASVDVVMPSNNKTSLEPDKIRALVWALDYYVALRELGKSFNELQLIFQLNFTYVLDKFNTVESTNQANTYLNNLISEYNRLQLQGITFVSSLQSNGVVDVDINNSLNGYFKAIDYFKYAVQDLYSVADGSTSNSDSFFNNIRTGMNEQNIGLAASKKGYLNVYQTIQNIQPTVNPSTNSKSELVNSDPIVIIPETSNVIKSKIENDFNGFDNGKIYELTNGQYWKQVDYTYKYSYKYRPDVLIYKDGLYYYMNVEGIDKNPRVELIE